MKTPLSNPQNALIVICQIIFETIHEMKKTVPEGPIYAALCGYISLDVFNKAIDLLVDSGHIERVGNYQISCRCFGTGFDKSKVELLLTPHKAAVNSGGQIVSTICHCCVCDSLRRQ